MARNTAANSKRYSIITAGPSDGAAMRMKRKELPQIEARINNRSKLDALMPWPQCENAIVAQRRRRRTPLLAMTWILNGQETSTRQALLPGGVSAAACWICSAAGTAFFTAVSSARMEIAISEE